jgi:hypothetical protein
MAIGPHLLLPGVVTVVVGWFMALAGIEKSALEWKRRRRTCPSCGREIQRGACKCVA